MYVAIGAYYGTMTMTMAKTSLVRTALLLAYATTTTTLSASFVVGFAVTNSNLYSSRRKLLSCRHDNRQSRNFVGRGTTTHRRRQQRHPHHQRRRWQQQHPTITPKTTSTTQLQNNLYDDWSSDLLSSSQSEYTYDDLQLLATDDMEESVVMCLEELMDSEFGKTMFGRHDIPASVG